MDSATTRMVRCFQAVFPDLNETEIRQATAVSVSTWDSVATVTLVSVVEEEFGIEISLDDVEQVMSFNALLKQATLETQ